MLKTYRGSEKRDIIQTRDLVRAPLFAALIAALALVPRFDLPFAAGVTITAQTLGVMLVGVLLGARLGAISVLLFLLVVSCGAPLLAGGRGGLGVFMSPTAGYLVGFVFGAFVTGWLVRALPVRSPVGSALIASLLDGVATIYLFGVPWLAWFAGLDLRRAFFAGLTFLPGDIIKAVATAFVAEACALVEEPTTGRYADVNRHPPVLRRFNH